MTKKLTIVEALREAIREEMERDPTVFCIGEDIGIPGGWGGAFTVTKGLSEIFGHERILDTPISEIGIFGAAVGAAIGGMRPIADVQYSDFLFCAMDQIVNQASKMTYMSGRRIKVPMVIRAPVGATQRGAQHAQTPISLFCHIPGLKVIAPSTAYDAKGMLKAAIRDDNPVLVFEHKLLYGAKRYGDDDDETGSLSPTGEIPEDDYVVPFGEAVIRRQGTDVTVVATLLMVYKALEAARELERDGISVEVIDPRSLVPLDTETIIKSVSKTGRLVIVDEDNGRCSWSSEVAALVAEKGLYYLEAPVKRITTYDTPIPCSLPLENFVIPSKERIKSEIKEMFDKTKRRW